MASLPANIGSYQDLYNQKSGFKTETTWISPANMWIDLGGTEVPATLHVGWYPGLNTLVDGWMLILDLRSWRWEIPISDGKTIGKTWKNYILWNLDQALSSPLPGKQTKGSGVSATHCPQRGADCVCKTLVPEMGPPFWKPFLLPAILRSRFLGRFWPIFGTTKQQTGAARRSWRPGFRLFAGASLPSAMQADMDTHTHTSV